MHVPVYAPILAIYASVASLIHFLSIEFCTSLGDFARK